MTLLELCISLAIFATVMVGATLHVVEDARAISTMARRTHAELRAEVLLDRIAEEIEFARGSTPLAFASIRLGLGETAALEVDTTAGFPDSGTLLIDRGTLFEERIAYAVLADSSFGALERGLGCTDSADHDEGAPVHWSGTAEELEDQIAPPAALWDGRSQELGGARFYRGDGSGFTFRVPVDPAGGGDFFDAFGQVRWGAEVAGAPRLTGRSALVFVPVATVSEAARGADLNADGDLDDTFDLGRIELRSWDTADPGGAPDVVGLCPPMILQEQCAWGSDLDGDGFEDPLFLWDPRSGRLRARFFLLTSAQGEITVVRRVEATFFLKNGGES